MSIYLSGPMTGIPDNNFPAFKDWATLLRAAGHEVISPAELGGRNSYEEYIRCDIEALLKVDAVVVMPGWESSKGCAIEITVARGIGLPVFDVRDVVQQGAYARALRFDDPRAVETSKEVAELPQETVLQEAQRLVHGDRGDDYGHPLDDFTKTGLIWQAVLGVPVTPEQVALCMVGVKISREVNKPKRDNRVDGPGYFETLDMVHIEKARRAEVAQ